MIFLDKQRGDKNNTLAISSKEEETKIPGPAGRLSIYLPFEREIQYLKIKYVHLPIYVSPLQDTQ